MERGRRSSIDIDALHLQNGRSSNTEPSVVASIPSRRGSVLQRSGGSFARRLSTIESGMKFDEFCAMVRSREPEATTEAPQGLQRQRQALPPTLQGVEPLGSVGGAHGTVRSLL